MKISRSPSLSISPQTTALIKPKIFNPIDCDFSVKVPSPLLWYSSELYIGPLVVSFPIIRSKNPSLL